MARGSFQRWLFGGLKSFPVPVATSLYLVVALAVAASLVLLNTTIALVAVTAPLAAAFPVVNKTLLTPGLLNDLTTTFNLVVAWMVVFGATLGIAKLLRNWKVSPRVRLGWTVFTTLFFTATLFVIISAGLAVPLFAYGHLQDVTRVPIWPELLDPARLEAFNHAFGVWSVR